MQSPTFFLSHNLHNLWEKYTHYLHEALMFEHSHDEIVGFAEWANKHYGTDLASCEEFLMAEAA